MVAFGLLLAGAGFALIFSGIKNRNPVSEALAAFHKTGPDSVAPIDPKAAGAKEAAGAAKDGAKDGGALQGAADTVGGAARAVTPGLAQVEDLAKKVVGG
jgi:hypothetical protein